VRTAADVARRAAGSPSSDSTSGREREQRPEHGDRREQSADARRRTPRIAVISRSLAHPSDREQHAEQERHRQRVDRERGGEQAHDLRQVSNAKPAPIR
jgi:hypothetical protein